MTFVRPDLLRSEVAHSLGSEPVWMRPVPRGNQITEAFRIALADGRAMFIKAAVSVQGRQQLDAEYVANTHVPRDLRADLVHRADGVGRPIAFLAFEDLGSAIWPPPWDATRVEGVLRLLKDLSETRASINLSSLETHRALLSGWTRIADDPAPFLSLGIRSGAWLSLHIGLLIELSAKARLEGGELVHFDVRSDNICIRGRRAMLVDWTWACRGNSNLDLLAWLPSLQAEGGPPPGDMCPNPDPAIVALLTGYWASQAGLPPPHSAPRVRALQWSQLCAAVPWMEAVLQL